MSQEYTEDKEVTLTKLSSGRRLLEALLILIVLFAVWLMAALLSFNPSDPSWSQTAWHEPIHNLGGMPGAWLADTLFFIFGVMAYTIPVIIVGGCWFAWRHQSSDEYIDYFAVSLRIIGVLALILTSCGLAAINADDIWYFASGGVIGSLLSTTLQPLLHSSGGTIALLCVWAAGLTLFTGWSWVTIAEKLGGWILNILTFASNRTRRDDTWVDEDEYEDEIYDDEYEDDDEAYYEESDDDELADDEEFYYEDEEEPDEEPDEEDAPDFEDEFKVDPKHSEEPDDREIPDEDDGIDIMSATTPLSRKETAKLIATGKTSPLPLDEISDALSMDTGFVVHGRYDLETQSGIGTRAGLTEEQKKLFSYFVPVRGMSEQLVDVLEQDKNCTNRKGTSKTGNLLIIGDKGNGKTVLAVDVVKAIQKQREIRQGKVAIVTGESLNKKKIGDIFDKLYGGALIIEKAGKMNEKTVAKLNRAMERDTGELLIVLEEQRKPLDRLLSSNREFRRKFTSRLEVPIFINDELVTFGQTYAQENGYKIDEMGILALYSCIDSLQREDHSVTVAEVKEVMDKAIAHSQKASAKKLVKRVFGRNTDSSDRIILSERDFNI